MKNCANLKQIVKSVGTPGEKSVGDAEKSGKSEKGRTGKNIGARKNVSGKRNNPCFDFEDGTS
jgi:hypothetical protein